MKRLSFMVIPGWVLLLLALVVLLPAFLWIAFILFLLSLPVMAWVAWKQWQWRRRQPPPERGTIEITARRIDEE